MHAKQVGGGLLAVGIVVLLVAAFAHGWRVASDGSGGAGLLSVGDSSSRVSYSELVDSESRDADKFRAVMWGGRAAFALCLASAVASALLLLKLLTNETPKNEWVLPLAFFTAAGGLVFLLSMPDVITRETNFGYSFYLFWTGLGLCVGGEKQIFRAKQLGEISTTETATAAESRQTARPTADDEEEQDEEEDENDQQAASDAAPTPAPAPAEAPSPPVTRDKPAKARPAMSPACPQCRAPTKWVAEHERFFCKRCDAYLDED